MNYEDIICDLRRLTKNENVKNPLLDHILLQNNCYYLYNKNKKTTNQQIILNSAIQLQQYKACRSAFYALENIPYAHIKGGALSSRIYGKPSYRFTSDIDILVSPSHIDIVKEILRNDGFIQGKVVMDDIEPYSRKDLVFYSGFSHQLAPFIKKTGNDLCPYAHIDVNFSVMWGESSLAFDIDDFLENTMAFELYGIKMSCLSPLFDFISLCLHHYKDMNSIYILASRGYNLSQFCDIYFYLKNAVLDVDQLVEQATKYGVRDYIYYCIYYANEIFGDPGLDIYLVKLNSPTSQKLLDCYGLSDLERREWEIPFYERLLDQKFRDKFYSMLNDNERKKIALNRNFL